MQLYASVARRFEGARLRKPFCTIENVYKKAEFFLLHRKAAGLCRFCATRTRGFEVKDFAKRYLRRGYS